MEPVLSSLPELDALGGNPETAPKFRHRRVTICVLCRDFVESAFEFSPARDRTALRRNNGAGPALQRALIEVSLKFIARDSGNVTFDLDLSLQPRPMEIEGSSRVLSQIATFTALVVGEEDKPSFIESFQKDDPGGRAPLSIGGRQGHCVRFPVAGHAYRLFEPGSELLYRVGNQVLSMQAVQSVLLAQ